MSCLHKDKYDKNPFLAYDYNGLIRIYLIYDYFLYVWLNRN